MEQLMDIKQISLIIPDGVQPVYSNLVRISHSPADLVLDFAHILPGEQVGKINARIVMSPLSTKLLHMALTEHLVTFEQNFGEIKTPHIPLADQLFNKINKGQDPEKGSEGEETNGSA
jgi:hypothetical protein